jgi:hypothetical protein
MRVHNASPLRTVAAILPKLHSHDSYTEPAHVLYSPSAAFPAVMPPCVTTAGLGQVPAYLLTRRLPSINPRVCNPVAAVAAAPEMQDRYQQQLTLHRSIAHTASQYRPPRLHYQGNHNPSQPPCQHVLPSARHEMYSTAHSVAAHASLRRAGDAAPSKHMCMSGMVWTHSYPVITPSGGPLRAVAGSAPAVANTCYSLVSVRVCMPAAARHSSTLCQQVIKDQQPRLSVGVQEAMQDPCQGPAETPGDPMQCHWLPSQLHTYNTLLPAVMAQFTTPSNTQAYPMNLPQPVSSPAQQPCAAAAVGHAQAHQAAAASDIPAVALRDPK